MSQVDASDQLYRQIICLADFCFSPLGEPRGAACPAPLAIPRGTQLRGPAGSLRCSICRGCTWPATHKLASLRHREHLFPDSPALLARSDGI